MNTEKRDLKLDEVLEELYYLREENQSLKTDNDFLQRQNNALKMRCSKYSLQITDLESEVADLRFTGKMFAADLLGKPMSEEDLAIEAAENDYRPYNGDDF
jgi:FtsZ-binding cell division protein ZapB